MHDIAQRKLRLHTVGPLKVATISGLDLTPKSKKARAVIAILAMSPEYAESRVALQDKLWSDRPARQAADSLRQVVLQLKADLGEYSDAIVSERTTVRLNPHRIEVLPPDHSAVAHMNGSLFDHFGAIDPVFDRWLASVRMQHTQSHAGPRSDTPQPGARKDEGRLTLIVERARGALNNAETIAANNWLDVIGISARELYSVTTQEDVNGRTYPQSAIVARAKFATRGNARLWQMGLSSALDGRMIWASGDERSAAEFTQGYANSRLLLREANSAVDAMREYASLHLDEFQSDKAAFHALAGSREFIAFTPESLERADQHFMSAHAHKPRATYLAWRAYIRTFFVLERMRANIEESRAEAQEFIRDALALEPQNSFVLSVAACIALGLERRYVAAFEFAQKSTRRNRANPLGWAFKGLAQAHLGNLAEGIKDTAFAREIADATPFRFQIDSWAAMTATMAGKIDEAIYLAESSRAFAPKYRPPLRYLSVLYLHKNEELRSHEAVHALQSVEPEFSYDILRDTSYPAASLRRALLLGRLPRRQI